MDDLSMADLEKRILECCDLLEQATHAVKDRGGEFARVDAAFDSCFYRELLRAKVGDVKTPEWVAKAHAMDAIGDLNVERKIAEAYYESAREAGRNHRAQAELLRTLAANLRPLVTER